MSSDRTLNDLVDQVLDGRYRVLHRLAEGGMSVVYVAEQLNVSRRVAIKILRPEISREPEMLARFRAEARIISDLRHPNTLKLFDYGTTEDGLIYLVTELLSGESLSTRLVRGPLSARETLRVLMEVLPSLHEAHERGIIHRDLKPGNLFLEEVAGHTVVKVLDFGIAKMKASRASDPDHPSTAAGLLLGTPAYLSPEQAHGKAVDARSDIYSLGVVAYHCVSGQVPFPGEPVAQMMAHISRPPPKFEELTPPPTVPGELSDLIFRWMSKKAGARPSNAQGALAEVQRVYDQLFGSGRTEVPASSGDETPTAVSRRRSVSVILALLLISGLIWVAFGQMGTLPIAHLDAGTVADASRRVIEQSEDAGFITNDEDAGFAPMDDAGIIPKIEPGVRVQSRPLSGTWRSPSDVRKVLDRIEPIAVDCYRRTQTGQDEGRFVSLTFVVRAAGVSVQVEPTDEAGAAYRRCLSFRLPKSLPWPARRETSTAGIIIGDVAKK